MTVVSTSLEEVFLLNSSRHYEPRDEPELSPGTRRFETFRNKKNFYGEGLLAPRPTPKLENHPSSLVRDDFFGIFTATLRIWRWDRWGELD
jgi:hypothetical protein